MNHNDFLLSQPVDLTNCDKEPIHIPGLIQPHGILFVLQEPQLKILQVSHNTFQTLGIHHQEIFGKNLSGFLDSQLVQLIEKKLTEEFEIINPLNLSINTPKGELFFEGILHRSDGLLILELEPVNSKKFSNFFSLYHLVQVPITKIQKILTLNELCQAIVEEVRKMTGFDRVMVYQFDAEDAGTVIAEDKLEGLSPYLGLHYPASDIPRQARHLYALNLLRLIPDVNYQPVELFPVDNPVTNQPLDLSFSVLRSVSPIHIEYLKNMGVGASMSISLIRNRKLWGLIACHHQSPKYVSYEVRTACELLGKVMALELASKADNEKLDYRIKLNSIQSKFVESIFQEESFVDGLLEEKSNLLDLVGAQGVAICANENLSLIGQTPELADIQALINWLATNMEQDIFYTDSLPKLYPTAEKFKEVASGLLALSISNLQKHYVVWFRPEVIQTVNWAGNPNKPVEVKQNGEIRLTPRKSFELWQETVRLKSLPWKPCEIEIALELRSTIVGIALRKADELAKVNQQLTLALEAAQMGIWDWDLLTDQITWSSGHEQLFGLEPGTFEGTYAAFEACVYPEDRDAIALAVEQARLERQDYHHEFRVVWADGSIHWIEAKGKFFYDVDGNAVRMLGTVREITDRIARVAQLRLLESVVITTNDAVVITEAEPIDEPGPRIVYVNPAFTRMTGYTLEEVLGKTPRILQGEKTDRAVLDRIRAALQTWQPSQVELLNYRKDGSQFWVELSIVPVADEKGWYTHWVAVQRDITERKLTEIALQESQRFIQQIADTAPNLIYIMDIVQQCNVYVNRYGSTFFGSPPEEIQRLGSAFFADALHPDDFHQLSELPKRCATAKDGEVLENEFRMKNADGEWRWFHTWDVVFSRTAEGLPQQILGTAIDITQAKQLEQARQQAEQQIRFQAGLLDAVEQSVIATDLAGNIIYWNRYAEVLYGWEATEVLGRSIVDVTPASTTQEQAVEIMVRLQAGESWSGEFWVQRRDGTTFPVLVIDSPIHDEQGELIGIIGISVDITERKQTEAFLQHLNEELEIRVRERTQELERSRAALQQQMERERLMMAIAQQIRQSLDLQEILDTTVTEVQKLLWADRVLVYRVWSNGTGSVIAEAVAPGCIKVLDIPLPAEIFPEECRQRYAEGRIYTLTDLNREEVSPCLADCLKQIQVRAKLVVPIIQQDTLWGLLIAHQCSRPREWQPWEIELLVSLANQMAVAIQQSELYQQLQNELKERQQVAAALRQSEAQFRSLSENSPVGILRMDAQGRCTYTNPCCQAICGYTFEEALGEGWLQFVHPEDREWLMREWLQTLSEQQEFSAEVRYVHQDGTIRFAQMRTSPLCRTSSQLMGYVGTVEDVTERRAIEQMKNEFISIVSHELRTPLASIRGSLGLLAAGVFKNKPDAAQQMLDIAAHDTERLVRLVNDILDLERLKSHKVNLVKQWCDAATLMRQSVETVQSLAVESQIALSVEPTSVQVWADRDRIIQTLVNLVSNAIKFSPPQSTVTLSVQDQADRVLFQVKDQGRGIPADKLNTIFGRFQQVDASDSRQKGGTGLGLAICKSIVQQHGGKIWVASVVGEGSSFYFTLPKLLD